MSIALFAAACIAIGLTIRVVSPLPPLVVAATLVGAIWLGAILATAPSAPVLFVGRTLTLDSGARAFVWLALTSAVVLAFFGLLTFRRGDDSPAAVVAKSQGAFFFFGLASFVIAIVLDSFPLAIFFWVIGLIVLMLLATPRRGGRVGGAAQFLLLTVIAAASLLLSNRFIELYPLTPENLDLVRNAVVFLSLGLGLLLAVVPLHIWLGPLADEMPSLGVAFLVGVAQPVGLWLLFQRMSEFLWLIDKSPLLTVLLVGGAITAPVGALLAIAERRDGRFIAYLSLVLLGHALIGLGLGTRAGLAGALLAIFNRAVGVALMAGGFAFSRYHPERRWQVVGAIALIGGGLGLVGIPPMLGFAARWAMYRDLAAANLTFLALLLASNALGIFATLRAASQLFSERGQEDASGEVRAAPFLGAAIAAILLAAIIIAGIFPQVIADPLLAELGKAAYLK